jgi:glycosyltransferase involved in cell wall biosynthesis
MSKRLAFFTSNMHGGGAQRVLVNLAAGIAERGYDVDLVLARAEGPYLAQVPDSVRIIDLKAPRVATSLPALVSYLRRTQPDAMLSALNYVNVVALWARRLAGVPLRLVISERTTLSRSIQPTAGWEARVTPLLVRRFYPWADGIVAVSKGVGDDLCSLTGLSSDRVQVIYNPVVTPELRVKAQAFCDHPWLQPGQVPVVLAVGRLSRAKDYATLLKAFAQSQPACSARLLILGEGEERPALEALVRELGLEQNVALPGFVENPYAYMKRASLFVLSSRREGLPGALIEALFCGLPIVATDCPSGPREILADGRYGQLVPVGDVRLLAEAIEKSLRDGISPAPPESWQPFMLETAVDQYLRILLEN